MKHSQSSSARLMGMAFIIIGVFVMLVVPRLNESKENLLFYISGQGQTLSETPKELTALTYTITIDNPGSNSYTITSIEPVISDELESLRTDHKPVILKKTKKLKARKSIEYSGELNLTTLKLDKEEIKQLLPVFKEYIVTYDNGQQMTLRYGTGPIR